MKLATLDLQQGAAHKRSPLSEGRGYPLGSSERTSEVFVAKTKIFQKNGVSARTS